jgi:membrane-bound metal-dependent hydrolase YbcI (DUF457 family)
MKRISSGWKEHTLIGFMVFAGLYITLKELGYLPPDPVQILLIFSLTILAALFPDIDTNSKGQDIFYGALVIIDGYLIYQQLYHEAAILGFLALMPVVTQHRGWTHSYLAAIILPLPLLYPAIFHIPVLFSGPVMYTAAVSGYVSHILIDKTQNGLLNGALKILFFWL